MLVFGSQLDDFLIEGTNDVEIIGANFSIDWSKVVMLYDNGKNCPQFYNPDFPEEFPGLESRAAKWLEYANLKPVLPVEAGMTIDPSAIHLGSEPEKGWCYYYERADLARQIQNWKIVRDLGDEAIFHQGLQTNLDTELNPFILAYALGGEWEKASELMRKAVDLRMAKDNAPNIPLVQSTWDFIDGNTPESTGKTIFRELIQQVIENP